MTTIGRTGAVHSSGGGDRYVGASFPRDLRQDVEEFLYHEAALLDAWRLDDWLELLTDDVQYTIPSTDHVEGDGNSSLVLINDDAARIRGRVNRLKSRHAHREFPTSRTRRMITNVRVVDVRTTEVDVTCNFVVYRIRGTVDPYVGRYLYTLVRLDGAFQIRTRRVELDLETLRPHGTISFIL